MNKIFLTVILVIFGYNSFGQILDTANMVISKKYVREKMSKVPRVDTLCRRGLIEYSMGKYGDGLSYFKQADNIDSNNAKIIGAIGFGYMRTQSYDDAIRNFNAAIEINEKDSSSKRNLIFCYLYKGDYNESILKGKQYQKEYPKDPESYYNLMTVYYAAKDLGKASKNGLKAVKLYEQQSSRSVYDAYYFLGKIYFEQKDFKKADQMFQKVRDRGIKVEEKYNKKI